MPHIRQFIRNQFRLHDKSRLIFICLSYALLLPAIFVIQDIATATKHYVPKLLAGNRQVTLNLPPANILIKTAAATGQDITTIITQAESAGINTESIKTGLAAVGRTIPSPPDQSTPINPNLPTPNWSWTPYGHYDGPTPSPTPGPNMSPLHVTYVGANPTNPNCVVVNGYTAIYMEFISAYANTDTLGGGTMTYFFDYSDGQSDGPYQYTFHPMESGTGIPTPDYHVFVVTGNTTLDNMQFRVRVTSPNNISSNWRAIPPHDQCYDADTIEE